MIRLSAIALLLALPLGYAGAAVAAPYMIPAPYVIPVPGAAPASGDCQDVCATEPTPAPTVSAVQPDHPSAAAAAACADSADGFNNVMPGISKVRGASKQGDFWVLTMSSGSFRSLCTVSRSGQVMGVVTGGY